MMPFLFDARSLYQAQLDAARSLQKWGSDAMQAAAKRQQHIVSDTMGDLSSHFQSCLRQSSPIGLWHTYLSYVEKRLPKVQGNAQEQIDFSTYSQREIQKILTNCLQSYIGTTKQTLSSFLA